MFIGIGSCGFFYESVPRDLSFLTRMLLNMRLQREIVGPGTIACMCRYVVVSAKKGDLVQCSHVLDWL